MHPHHIDESEIPPFSPRPPVHDPDKSTAQLLDSLAAFYRQEMLWVYRTRAAQGLANRAQVPDPQPSPNTVVVDEDVVVKVEPEDPPPITPSSRWHQRKHRLKLRLELPHVHRSRVDDYDPAMRVLDLFEHMVEARMESCQRMNRLVRRNRVA